MNTNEMKKKINNLIFGLHSTSPKDNNALPEILNELTDGVAAVPEQIAGAKAEVEAEIPSFFEVNGVPDAGATSVEALDSAGFTKANIAAAAEGKVSYIKLNKQHFSIVEAFAQEGDEGSYSIAFLWRRVADMIISRISVTVMGPAMVFATVGDESFKTPPALTINGAPTAGMTKEQIEAIGFTTANMNLMASGQITTVCFGNAQYPIKKAAYNLGSGQGTVVFSNLTYDATNSKWVGTQYTIITQENPTAAWSVAVDTLS